MDATKRKRILASLTRNPGYENWRIAKNLGVSVADVAEVRGRSTSEPTTEPGPRSLSGINLASRRVLSRRPAESAAKFIKRLPAGKGFSPRDLAGEWGMSEETIKRHARDMGCLKFVEVSEDEWQSLIMSPETAAQYD